MMSQALTSRTLTLRVSIIDSGKRAVSQSETVSFYSRESGIGAPTLAMGKSFKSSRCEIESSSKSFVSLFYTCYTNVYIIFSILW
jgi:hypothetical protein